MKYLKKHMSLVMILFAVFLLTSCTQKKTTFMADDLNPKLQGKYEQKVDNFLIIFDNSSSMFLSPTGKFFSSKMKIDQEKDLVNNLNQTIPDLNLMAGFRKFGGQNELTYGVESYSKNGLAGAVKAIGEPIGYSPLDFAFYSAIDDLAGTSGDIAVIAFSDGEDMNSTPVDMAKSLKVHYGDRLCIYTVHIGTDRNGANLLNQVADAGQCGFATNAQNLSTSGGMSNFVQQVFLKEKVDGDSDGDGVVDSKDRCPNTPKGAPVDKDGCPLDSDKDGVFDYLDKCPNTPQGLKVDAVGCPLPLKGRVSITLLVEFDHDKATIRPEFHDHLSGVANFLKTYPDVQTKIEGHTDSSGSDGYNLTLSQRRADSVKNYLVSKFGIDATRLSTQGHGENEPIASNASKEGRQRNRRVMADLFTEATK